MKFDHMVKFNDVYYKAGEEVPMGASSQPIIDKQVEVQTEDKAEVKVTKRNQKKA